MLDFSVSKKAADMLSLVTQGIAGKAGERKLNLKFHKLPKFFPKSNIPAFTDHLSEELLRLNNTSPFYKWFKLFLNGRGGGVVVS